MQIWPGSIVGPRTAVDSDISHRLSTMVGNPAMEVCRHESQFVAGQKDARHLARVRQFFQLMRRVAKKISRFKYR